MTITDGTYYCGRCGDDRVSCWLCAGEESALVKRQEPTASDMAEAERELEQQTRSIRRAADIRQGFG